MPFGSAAQTDFMLQHAGSPVTLGTASAYGIYEITDVIEQDGDGVQMQVRRPTLVLRRGALTGLRVGVTVTVDGDDYKVREIAREDDGTTVRCILAEV